MIPYWRVIQNVADRYGKLEEVFDRAHEKLQLVRDGKLPFMSLEENEDRVRKRIAREKQPFNLALERIIGITNFQDKYVLDKLSALANTVCRLSKRGNPIGTGFLIAEGVIITNHHVIENPEDANDMIAEFNFELGLDLVPKRSSSFKLDSKKFFLTSSVDKIPDQPGSGLDFTIVAVRSPGLLGESIEAFDPVQLDGNVGKIIKGESCVIIQHPSGLVKKIVLKDTAFFSETGTRIIYESDTLPGSSGSMVVALGTCEVIALHHSSIPRTDDQNRPLTKSGTIADENTPESEIAWVGNEGIKVSCIIQAVTEATLPAEMEPLREKILNKTEKVERQLAITAPDITQETKTTTTMQDQPLNSQPKTTTASTLYFEIILNNDPMFQDAWDLRAKELIPGLVDREALISDGTYYLTDRMEYITVSSDKDPWALAEEIENLPHVDTCTPDLESYTDIGLTADPDAARQNLESVVLNDGTGEVNEGDFITKWGASKWYTTAHKTKFPNYHRQWNWLSVNCPPDIQRKGGIWADVEKNLGKIRFVQLDTGYTRHSKTFSGYDLLKDFDFIDNDRDAEDRLKELSDRFLLKFPSHGTRTASLAVGNKLFSDPTGIDGNSGILTFNGANPTPLIPYRIAKSVILLGRGKEMVNAASSAIQNSTDVMFMCMGSYPRPMFEVIAREAYTKGVIWICAAGNEVELIVAPAMYPGTVAVAAVNPNDFPWTGSSNGSMVDIAAPGEAVYVPFVNKEGKEIMGYGDGTSYATPHVASAAVLWKAKHFEQLKTQYVEPWMIVEGFRHCLKASARVPAQWRKDRYGAGILDIEKLLNTPLPDPRELVHAYHGMPEVDKKDLGLREAAHFLWNAVKRKLKAGPLESIGTNAALSARGKAALSAYSTSRQPLESLSGINAIDASKLLRNFFNQ